MTVRMKDIATDLNLSKMTISKVLRGQTDVSEATKARVLQRAKELNYRPNISARSLRTGRTYRVGLVVPCIKELFFAVLAGSVVEHLRTAGYVVSLSAAEGEAEVERQEVEQQLAWRVDALILASVQSPTELQSFAAAQQIPLVLIPTGASVLRSNCVLLREEEIGRMAAEHLVSRGCRAIANVRGPRSGATDLRLGGFRAALGTAGLRFRPELVADADGLNMSEYQRGYSAADRLLSARPRPDGIVCHSDLLAVGVMDRLLAAGFEIPRDMLIIGCGNLLPVCEMRVPLTSLDLAPAELGERAAKMVLKLLRDKIGGTSRNVSISPRLVLRQSTDR